MKIAQVGEIILKTPATQVTCFDAELVSFVDELIGCMVSANGIGIAATQVFDSRAIMIVASRSNARYPNAPEMEPLVLINPSIIKKSGEVIKDWEGCLSVPGIRGLVPRESEVKFEYQDVKGKPYKLEWEDFLARVFLHEYDHLIGKTWLDRIESVSDIVAESVYMDRVSKDS